MRVVHIGDIHYFRQLLPPWRLLSRRVAGQVNLWLNRARRFNRDLLPTLVDRVIELNPDHVLFSGDLTTTSMHSEFHAVVERLKPILETLPVTAVPGNHDRYTHGSLWSRRMERYLRELMPASFPAMVTLNDRWRLLALNAAVPRLFSSRGKVGSRQLAAARTMLQDLTADDGLVVLCHYPLGSPPGSHQSSRGHMLEDEQGLLSLLRDTPAKVAYLHGHIHEPWVWPRPEADLQHVVDIDAGAPCMLSGSYPYGQGFWELHLPDDVAVWPKSLKATHHVLQRATDDPDAELVWTTRDVEPGR